MDAEKVREHLAELPYQPLTTDATGRLLYELTLTDGVEDVLELGFAHGTSTAYMAAALEEKGVGCVTTIDRRDALKREPNVYSVLRHLGLEKRANPILVATSYNWELMRMIEERTSGAETEPCFDFCFLDGAHTWETDGLAFVLVDRLLRKDRWIVFDDVSWAFATSPTLKDSERVRSLPEEERSSQQVRKILDLLVRTTPGYDVHVIGNLALAYKADREGECHHRGDFDRLVGSHDQLVHELALGPLRGGAPRSNK